MARTLQEIERDLEALRREVEELKREAGKNGHEPEEHPIRKLAGCFTGDEEWAAIHDEIEARRRAAREAEL